MTVEEFNKKFRIGSLVNYHAIIGQKRCQRVRVRSKAWKLSDGTAVVKVSGIAGCVALEAISQPAGMVTTNPAADGSDQAESRINTGHQANLCWSLFG
ncbi:MAG TPA: hypothetical protein VGB07_36310 [Blastocatellia bacterium]